MKFRKTPERSRSITARLRLSAADKLSGVAEGLGLVFALSGATVAAVLGKLVVGAVLGALALGFLFRLKGRRKRPDGASRAPRASTAARFLTGMVSAVEVAALVEATNLPVRFDQAGFHMGHWYLVVLVFLAACVLPLPLAARLLGRLSARRPA